MNQKFLISNSSFLIKLVLLFILHSSLALSGVEGFINFASAQTNADFALAKQYYNEKDYEKSEALFQKLYKKTPNNGNYYVYYYFSLIQLRKFDAAEKVAKGQAKRYPNSSQYKVDWGYALELNGNIPKSENVYKEVVKETGASINQVNATARAFQSRRKFNYAIETYQMGRKGMNDESLFIYELGNLYNQANNKAEMIKIYIELLKQNPLQMKTVQNLLQARLEEENYDLMREILIKEIQQNPDKPELPELMIWFFVQQKDYNSAFIQAKALDRRFKDSDIRILRLARVADENKDYEATLKMYQYLIDKGKNALSYIAAKTEYLDVFKRNLLENDIYTKDDLLELESQFLSFFKEFGKGIKTLKLQRSLANLQAIHLNKIEDAKTLLENAKNIPGLNPKEQAEVKLELGDYYLMGGDVWEPALLYGQVDKAFKDEPIGQEAKYRNARLSFYRGEFEWSQAQFDVLKASTSQKISNDAIALSLLIQDNLGLDTIFTTMEIFAEADLLAFRNQDEAAKTLFDSILRTYPGHSITDEVWMALAKIELKARDYEKAIGFFDKIVESYADDILADDALYQKAILVEEKLRDKDQAKLLYQKMLLDYPNSIFAVDARKRFRLLRGDFIDWQ